MHEEQAGIGRRDPAAADLPHFDTGFAQDGLEQFGGVAGGAASFLCAVTADIEPHAAGRPSPGQFMHEGQGGRLRLTRNDCALFVLEQGYGVEVDSHGAHRRVVGVVADGLAGYGPF